jgi:hypothetical protein
MIVAPMTVDTRDTLMRTAAFEHVRRLGEVHDHLTAAELKPGFVFQGERIPLINPQRGIFKPQQMRFLLSIKTVFPRPGGKVWYDDQREVHRQIFEATRRSSMPLWGRIRTLPTTDGFTRRSRTRYQSSISSGSRRALPGHTFDLHFRVGRQGVKGARRIWLTQ